MPNPNHEPAGSSIGGQFAEGKGNAAVNKMIRGGDEFDVSFFKQKPIRDAQKPKSEVSKEAKANNIMNSMIRGKKTKPLQ